ncbi:Histone-lysine N-methyltransferase SETMAR, partial [Habropoda laboriosa]
VHEKLNVHQPTLVNKNGPIHLLDNTQPSTTVQKLHQLGIEVYSSDLSPIDFHVSRSLDNFLTQKQITRKHLSFS